MTNEIEKDEPKKGILDLQDAFEGDDKLARERAWGMWALKNNKKLHEAYMKDRRQFDACLVQCIGFGLTLNPAEKLAYLVPRGNKNTQSIQICLDISYRGLIYLAVKDGLIDWAFSDVVCEGEELQFSHVSSEPLVHTFNPFMRGINKENVIGAYCTAKLACGDLLNVAMGKQEIEHVRGNLKYESSVWRDHYGEMAKKTVIRRASKNWFSSKKDSKLHEAVEYLNVSDSHQDNRKDKKINIGRNIGLASEFYDNAQ